MKFSFHPEAESEFIAAQTFYDDREFGLGEEFMDEDQAAIGRIIRDPNAWPRYSRRTRRCICNRFPYSVIYRVSEGSVANYAVAHQSRKPGYWKDRLS